ncbi:MAG: site-specific DNA-methyltransferase [Deltaproteobacteria bacterium]|jgi:modification methylase|nr:site-specific DNA-methyltransferase [Deltaproteobacteria bacterium]
MSFYPNDSLDPLFDLDESNIHDEDIIILEDLNVNEDSLIEFRNKIICGDVLKIIKRIPDNSVDLVVTSPPYNIKNSTGNGLKDGRGGKWSNAGLINGYADHSDNMPYEDYVLWQRNCLSEMLRVIPENGAIFYNHKWRVQNGLLQDRAEIVKDFPVRQIIIWKRKGGINFNRGYFLPTYEVIYLIAKPHFKLAPQANKCGDVWDYAQETKKNEHPAPFPLNLIEHIVKSTTARIVLDPFMGSGTTALAALKNKRDYIGIELSENYCKMAKQRIQEFKNKNTYKDGK